MTPTTTYLLVGILGFVFHSLLKLKGLNDDARAASIQFNWINDYLKKDIFGILAAFLSPFVWFFLFGEIAKKYPSIQGFAITSFFVMGALGSYVLQLLLGTAKKQIRKIVDIKTNVADKVTGGTETVHETIEKAKEAGITVESSSK